MSTKTKRSIGIGCGVVAVVFLMVIGGGIYLAKQMADQYRTVHESEQALLAVTGDPLAWRTPMGGVPAPDRIEAFVTVREATAEWRVNLQSAIDDFLARKHSGRGGLGRWWEMFRAGSDLAPVYAGFWTARNEALTDQAMNPAEYIYLYVLAYYGELGRSVDDGYHIDPADTSEPSAERAEIDRRRMIDELRRALLPLLQEMVFATDADRDPGAGLAPQEVAAELERLRADSGRLPWQDGLPPVLTEALAPFRTRIAAEYFADVNPVELLFESVTADDIGEDGIQPPVG